MPGTIGLRIDREPDFFRLLALRGEGAVLVDEEEGEIRGCLSLSGRTAWVAGQKRSLCYVGDMKVHPSHRRKGVGAGLAVAALEWFRKRDADLLACVVAQGNRRVLTFLEGKFQIPPFHSLGSLRVLMILASRRGPGRGIPVREGREGDLRELAQVYRESCRAYELAVDLEEEDWRRALAEDPAVGQVLVAGGKGGIRALAVLFDVQWAKRHVVISLPPGLSALTSPLRTLGPLSPAFRVPRPGESVALLSLRHVAAREGDTGALRCLVQEARRRAHAGGYTFVVAGVHEKDPISRAFRGLPHFTMGSELFLTSLKGNAELVEDVARGVPVEDYAVT